MKPKMKSSKKLILLLLALFGLALVGCEQDTPLQAIDNNSSPEPTAVSASGKTIHFLGFAEKNKNTLNKKKKTEEYIQKDKGGDIKLDDKTTIREVKFHLKIPKNSIDFGKLVSMEYDDQNFEGFADLVFGPHGTQFSSPALLDFEVKGLDLTGVNPEDVKLFYVNENGQWEEMVAKKIEVKVQDGKVKIDDAELPHFSRYALAAD
jgi:hypothetical protein